MVPCLWPKMESTSWSEVWLFSKVTVHWPEVKVLWGVMEIRPVFTFSLEKMKMRRVIHVFHKHKADQDLRIMSSISLVVLNSTAKTFRPVTVLVRSGPFSNETPTFTIP